MSLGRFVLHAIFATKGFPEMPSSKLPPSRLRHSFGLVLVTQLAVNVRPEFFDLDRDRVVNKLRAPHAGRIRQSPVRLVMNVQQLVGRRIKTSRGEGPGMIGICGNRRRQSAAKNFRIIELRMAEVRSGEKDATHRIACAMKKSALARLIKPGILMEQRRKNRAYHHILDCPISEG